MPLKPTDTVGFGGPELSHERPDPVLGRAVHMQQQPCDMSIEPLPLCDHKNTPNALAVM